MRLGRNEAVTWSASSPLPASATWKPGVPMVPTVVPTTGHLQARHAQRHLPRVGELDRIRQ